jgi:hypothetical protein
MGVLFAISISVHAQDDDDDAAKNATGTTPTLNKEQRDAVGIVVAKAVAAKPAERVAAFGQVLDPAALIAELGEVDANRAAERAASAEVARLQGLYKAGASASLRNLEAASRRKRMRKQSPHRRGSRCAGRRSRRRVRSVRSSSTRWHRAGARSFASICRDSRASARCRMRRRSTSMASRSKATCSAR